MCVCVRARKCGHEQRGEQCCITNTVKQVYTQIYMYVGCAN